MVTLVFSVPTIVFSFYGMNVPELPFGALWLGPIAVAFLLVFVALYTLRRKRII